MNTPLGIMTGIAVAAVLFAFYFYAKYADERDLRKRDEEMRKGVEGR